MRAFLSISLLIVISPFVLLYLEQEEGISEAMWQVKENINERLAFDEFRYEIEDAFFDIAEEAFEMRTGDVYIDDVRLCHEIYEWASGLDAKTGIAYTDGANILFFVPPFEKMSYAQCMLFIGFNNNNVEISEKCPPLLDITACPAYLKSIKEVRGILNEVASRLKSEMKMPEPAFVAEKKIGGKKVHLIIRGGEVLERAA